MLHHTERPSEARRLTDVLRAGGGRSAVFERAGPVAQEKATLQLVLDGAVLRQRYLSDGRHHTVAVYYQDDVLNLQGYLAGGRGTHGSNELLALEGTVIGSVPDGAVSQMRAFAPVGHDGLSVLFHRELGIAQERTTSLAVRTCMEAMAHFFCETMIRCAGPIRNNAGQCTLSLTQDQLASVLGISVVHTNRTLQQLRQRGLVEFSDHKLVIIRFSDLADLADFEDKYLDPI